MMPITRATGSTQLFVVGRPMGERGGVTGNDLGRLFGAVLRVQALSAHKVFNSISSMIESATMW